MAGLVFIPNAGRMPALENLPGIMHIPVQELAKLEGITGVVSSRTNENITLLMAFDERQYPDYTKAIKCLAGLKPQRLEINKEYKYIEVCVRC